MPVHSAPSRPSATCLSHDHSSGSDFRSQCAIALHPLSRASGMWSPWGSGQQLDGKALDEILVGKYRSPVRATVGIVAELPQMDELIDRARVGLEIADQLLVLAAFLERRVAELGIQLDCLGHLADVKRVGPHFINRHGDPPSRRWVPFSERVWTGQTGGKRVVRWPRAVKESERWTGVDRIAGKHEDSAPEETMKGVVFLGDRKLELREFPDPTPGPRDVILEIKASGMCGSDLHNYRASAQPAGAVTGGIKREAGVIAGHEPCGIVAAVGAGVTEKEARVGQRVMDHHYDGCGNCKHCRAGWTQMCLEGTVVYGSGGNGGHARYMKVPVSTLVPLPDALSFVTGAAISCGTGTAWGALRRLT